MSILIIGATGNVGRPTVKSLLAKGLSVRALSRSAEGLARLPIGVEGVTGNLDTGDGLKAACANIERLFLIVSNGESETAQGLTAVTAAKAAGVKHIVYLSIIDPGKEPQVPHYLAKLPVEEAIRNSGADYTFIRPNYFMQTDLSVMPVITEHGVYPMPIGSIGNNRIDTRDIADCAVRVLSEEGHAGADYALQGPETMNGDQVADAFARVLNRNVVYGGDDVDSWAKPLEAFVTPWLLNSLKQMFLGEQVHGGAADAAAVEASVSAVGHPLRTFSAFLEEVASSR